MANKEIKEIKEFFLSRNMNSTWSFIDNQFKTRGFMTVCFELVKAGYTNRLEVITQEEKSAFSQIKMGRYTVTGDTLKRIHRLMNVEIWGYEVANDVLVKKELYDFFHFARITLDTIAQAANQAVLKNPIDIKSVSFYKIRDELKKHMRKSPLSNLFISMAGDPADNNSSANDLFKYLCEIDNNIKHNGLIGLNLYSAFIFGEDKFTIEEFSDRSGNPYPACDVISQIENIYNYINEKSEEAVEMIMNHILIIEGQQNAGQ